MRLNDAFSAFLRQKCLENKTEKTIDDYSSFVAPFIRFAGPDLDSSLLTLERVEEYILTLHERPLAPATMACYIRHIKAFISFLAKKRNLTFSPSEIKVPKYNPDEFYIFSKEEIRLIFSSVDLKEAWIAARNRAILALMLDSGLRQGEVCSLKWEWVDFEKGQMKVYGKGRKYRHVPLGQLSSRYLKEYAALCPFQGTPYVFSQRLGGQIDNNTVKKFVSKMKKKLPFPFYSHLLRHNFATNWCLNQYHQYGTMDVYALKAVMGHEDIKTTQRYLHYAESLLAVQHSISHLDGLFPSGISA